MISCFQCPGWLVPFCPCACVGFLQVLWFPPIVKDMLVSLFGDSKVALDVDVRACNGLSLCVRPVVDWGHVQDAPKQQPLKAVTFSGFILHLSPKAASKMCHSTSS